MRANGHHVTGSADPGMRRTGASVDFSLWSHDTLAKFAEEAYLRILELEADLEMVMEAYRAEVKREK